MRSRLLAALITLGAIAALASVAGARVLRVGSFHGIKGQFKTIQGAVDAASPGDWVLVGPGDYKQRTVRAPKGLPGLASGILVTKPDVWIRGMNRNSVVIDGTKPGTPKCSRKTSDQTFGPPGARGSGPLGLNGLMVWKADNVWVQNLTACNFLHGSGDTGNEIWWNGGDGGGGIGGHGLIGSYLTATNTFYKTESTAAQYGIFTSHWTGGTLSQLYASNFNDSGFYIGGCKQLCDQTLSHGHAQFNALGYSGTNSGGRLVVQNSEFDHNQDGFDTNSQNADFPSPQNGACSHNGTSPITHTHSCWVVLR